MKQLNLRNFNINSKKNSQYQKETKTSSISRRFRPFSDNLRLLQEISEDYRKFPKISRLPKISDKKSENFGVSTCERYIFYGEQIRFFFPTKRPPNTNRIFCGNSSH